MGDLKPILGVELGPMKGTGTKTIRNVKVGKMTLRLVEKGGVYIGVIFDINNKEKVRLEGEDPDDVWRRLHDEANKADPRYFGFDGARTRFLRFFPGGFRSERYAEYERDYKLAAKARLDEEAPLSEAAAGSGFGEAVLSAFRATNLLYPVEKTRLQGLLRGPDADTFVRAAAAFALGEGKPALLEMERVLKRQDNARWTVVTYLPFLWRPEAHMFLKPIVTQDFASRVGHRFALDYEARLDMVIYDSLLDLASKTEEELEELNPRDRIDVQSFIWTVGSYEESDMPAQR